MTQPSLWRKCLERLEGELSAQQFNTWIRPLQPVEEPHALRLLAPNRFVMDWVKQQFLGRITELATDYHSEPIRVYLEIGSQAGPSESTKPATGKKSELKRQQQAYSGRLNPEFTFANHVEGLSNQFARAYAIQAGENPGRGNNPLLIYGGVGLGKTHLMQAAGHLMLHHNPSAKVAYVHSERFVAEMVKALQHNNINEFKRYYRSLDALLIDDIQFFAGKSHSQEEFFHTFNTLVESQRQLIMTSDRLPDEIKGVEERLSSRFKGGLSQGIDQPDKETRAAILQKKANSHKVNLPEDVANFIAANIESNVRELEGALHRVIASARFTERAIDIVLAKEALRDLLVYKNKQISIENIKSTVAEYYKMRVSELHSKRRSRQITRPRQLAMSLAKELTNLSLPEIGDAFGGRDHTTVIHACRKIDELKEQDFRIKEDYTNLKKRLRA